MKLIDSHTHLNFPDFKDNYQEIIADCLKKGIGIVNIGADFESSKRAVDIANEYFTQSIYASIGMHPESMNEKFVAEKFKNLINNKVVAVGEIGLEYFFNNDQKLKEKQKELFKQQLEFAIENNLPVILHARGSKDNPDDAYLDILAIISQLRINGVVHCFGANLEIAQKFLDLDFYLGFTGIITFKNKSVESLREVVKFCPSNKILVETDAPWLTPEPHRGEQNLPQYVELIAQKVAALKGLTTEEVYQTSVENWQQLFKK
ncbi:MAG TPA: TatD family hydrolase [bacterium]|nr:TatD family hydrolase [bacterium]